MSIQNLTTEELVLLKASREEGQALSADLQEKINHIVNGFDMQNPNDDDICCNYFSNGDRYIKTSKQNCHSIGGSEVDSSACAS
jgi:hypothetical protein